MQCHVTKSFKKKAVSFIMYDEDHHESKYTGNRKRMVYYYLKKYFKKLLGNHKAILILRYPPTHLVLNMFQYL